MGWKCKDFHANPSASSKEYIYISLVPFMPVYFISLVGPDTENKNVHFSSQMDWVVVGLVGGGDPKQAEQTQVSSLGEGVVCAHLQRLVGATLAVSAQEQSC